MIFQFVLQQYVGENGDTAQVAMRVEVF